MKKLTFVLSFAVVATLGVFAQQPAQPAGGAGDRDPWASGTFNELRLRAIGPDGLQPGRVRFEHICLIASPPVVKIEQWRGPVGIRQLEENPASLLPTADETRFAQDSDVSRYAWLALAQHLRQFADRQLHRPQQCQYAQPRRVGQRLEKRGKLEVPGHGLRI